MVGIAVSDTCLTQTRWDTPVFEENIVLCLFEKIHLILDTCF